MGYLFRSVVLLFLPVAWAAGGMCHAVPLAPATQPGIIVLEAPRDYQVFQRRTRQQGTVTLRGHLHRSGHAEFRITGQPLEGQLPATWQPLTVDPVSQAFDTAVPVPAGGWYQVELRMLQEGAAAIAVTVPHVGVGEVFVIAGQSNSTNYGAEKQKPLSGKVATFDGHVWRPADDPQPGTQDGSKGGSFLPAFGDALVAQYQVPIGVASTGCGATSVREWLPAGQRMKQQPTTGGHVKPVGPGVWECTGQLFDGLLRRITALGPHGFRAVLWHQGESDAGQARGGYPADRQITGAQYHDWMKLLISVSQKQAGWDFPWLVALATYHSAKDAEDAEFRAAQAALWKEGIAEPGPDTDKLGPAARRGVHFNGPGQQAHGKLWAQQVGLYLDKVLKAPGQP